jgi:acyl dehydratase
MAALDYSPDLDADQLAAVEALTGTPIRVEPYNREAGLDVIRHYAYGIGDDNPLYCEPGYAADSPYGTVIAPPTFLYSVFDGAIGAGLPGIQPIYSGTEWTFYKAVRRGDLIEPHGVFGPIQHLSGRHAASFIIQTADTAYAVDGRVVARARAGTFRVPRRGANGGLAYEPRTEYRYSANELAAIREAALTEPRRGAEPLDVARIEVGEPIPAVVKGPIDRITMTAYYAGCIGSPGYKACEMAWKYREYATADPGRLPDNYDPSYFAEQVLPSLGHQDPEVAAEIGMPGAYDNGPQRCGWFAHAVTNWMGDTALLHKLSVRLRRPDIFGDTLWISGEVTAVRRSDEFGVVEVALRGVNQLGEQTASATATVVAGAGQPVELTDGASL